MRGVLDLPDALVPIQGLIADALGRVERVFDGHLASELPPVDELCAHVERYRGKMLRPILVLLSALAASPESPEAFAQGREGELVTEDLVRLAAVCEMVHMATLVHDDVLDDAQLRRRGATLNHLRGNEAAVILGDYLIAGAYHLCATIGRPDLDARIARISMDLCAGELLQLHNRDNLSLDEPTYFEIVRRKTGTLIGVSCQLGAALAGAAETRAQALYDTGVRLGVAFQIRDDLLDLTGAEQTVGKSVGKDLEKGKLTLPILHHLGACAPLARGRAIELIPRAGHDPDAQAQLRQGLAETGSIAYAESVAADLVERSRREIAALPDTPARAMLDALCAAIVDRAL